MILNLIILLLQQPRKNIFQRYGDIFSDPFFWVMLIILSAVIYYVFWRFGRNDAAFSEERAHFETQLKYYGYTFKQANFTGYATADKDLIQRLYTIEASNNKSNGGNTTTTLNATVQYRKGQIIAITWQPDISLNA